MQEKSIIINEKKIDIFASLECGQTFRFEKISEKEYVVFSLDKKAVIYKDNSDFVIKSNDLDYFYNYFALDVDYDEIFNKLQSMNYLSDILNDNTKRLRILKQDPFEMIISFIISANNNIPRIKKIINLLCEKLGKNMGDYFAFPSVDEMDKMPLEFYRSIGLGYRAEYIKSTVKDIKNAKIDIYSLSKLNTLEAKEKLMSLKGVGPKVCDCILLFGYNKFDVFPVDTWIKKVYVDIFKSEATVNKMRQDLINMFWPYPAIAQQYLFFAKRQNT